MTRMAVESAVGGGSPASFAVPGGLRVGEIPCDPGHDVVYGLARGAGNEVYLAASNEFTPGLCAVVFAFDLATRQFRPVIDVREMTGFEPASGRMPHSKIHLALNATRGGRVFAATHFTAPGVGQKEFDPIAAYRNSYDGCFLLEYDPATRRAASHGRLVPGEGARIACLDDVRGQYYFLSYPRNHLFRYDYHNRELEDLGRVGQENAFGLEVDDEGNVYTSDDRGRIVIYSFARAAWQETELFLPTAPGRHAHGNYIRRMTRATDGCFYGFTNKGVRLFRIDPRQGKIDDFGVIYGREARDRSGYPKLPPAKAVVHTGANTLLVAFGGDGIYGDDIPVPNLVRYDLEARRADDLGKFVDPRDGLPAWIPQCGLHVPEVGVALFGLQQTIGRLRLWEVATEKAHGPRYVSASQPYRAHAAVIARQPFGASVEGSDALPYVRRGHVRLHELGWGGEDAVIPAGETAIGSLAFAGDTLYGVTVGIRSHLFCFRPYQQNRFTENHEVHPWDLGVLEDAPVEQARLWVDEVRGRLVILTQARRGFAVYGYPMGAERRHYRGTYHSLPHWPPVTWPERPFTPLHRDEEALLWSAACLSDPDRLIWTTSAGDAFSTSLAGPDTVACGTASRGDGLIAVDASRFVRIGASGGGVYQANHDGSTARLNPLPPIEGHATCAAIEPSLERIAVGTQAGTIHLVPLGNASAPTSVRLPQAWPVGAMVWQGENVVGFQGHPSAIGEAFAVRARTGEVRPIGILQSPGSPRFWICHACRAMAAGSRGEVYFGEHDRIAHLFSYVEAEGER